MHEQNGQAGPAESHPHDDIPGLHVSSSAEATEATARGDRWDDILRRADARDRAAERRDREAEGRDSNSRDIHAALDRDWAGRDRDRAAEDRADLLALVRKDEPSLEPPGTDEPRR